MITSMLCSILDLSFLYEGPSSVKSLPPPNSQIHFSTIGRSKDRFLLIFGRPRSDPKINDFSTPPKSTQGAKKSTQGRHRVDFSWILMPFGGPFFMVFVIFSKMSKTMKSSCGLHQGSILRIQHLKNHSFFFDFSINFSFFRLNSVKIFWI